MMNLKRKIKSLVILISKMEWVVAVKTGNVRRRMVWVGLARTGRGKLKPKPSRSLKVSVASIGTGRERLHLNR